MEQWQGITPEIINAVYPAYCSIPGLSKVLQPFWYGDDEEGHIEYLLKKAAFPLGARILDAGSGTGKVSDMMKEQRNDLDFTLLNFSFPQLMDAENDLRVCTSATDMPFANESFDGVMFNDSLCNMNHRLALSEAQRVLKSGGTLFLNELERIDGDDAYLEKTMMCHAYPHLEIMECLTDCELVAHEVPDVKRFYLKEIWGETGGGIDYDLVFNGIVPGIWKFKKKEGVNYG